MFPYTSRILPLAAVLAVALAAVIIVSRVLAVPNDTTGDLVLGQPGFVTNATGTTATAMYAPSGVAIDSANNVYVADAANNRVIQFDDPQNTDTIADRVFGQGGSFTSKFCNLGGISASSLCYPEEVAVDAAGNLFVVDWQNHRVLEYFTPTTTDTIADRVFGQLGSFTTDTYWSSPTANTLTNPYAVAIDPAGNLYIGDRGMHRVLQYNPPLSNTTADRVFGQLGSFTTGAPNNGGIGADTLAWPNGIGVDNGGNLYVADSINSRALMFKTPITTDTTADVVFGQLGSFTTANPNINGVSADSLDSPTDIGADGAGNVYITDTGTERTTVYDAPLYLGTTADVVFGQLGSFSSWGINTGGLNAAAAGDPWALGFDNACNLWIADYGNNRVLRYDKPPHACVDAPLPTPTGSPVPTPPVLNTAPGTISISFNGGTAYPRGVDLALGGVTGAGMTTMETSHNGPPPPFAREVMGFHAHGGPQEPVKPVYYNIGTTATLSGTHTVCIRYDGSLITPGNIPQLMHHTGGSWADITTTITPDSVICGTATTFSPFAVMQAVDPVGGLTELPTSSGGASANTALWLLIAIAAVTVASAGGLAALRRRS